MESLDPLIGNNTYDNTNFCFGKEGETYVIYLQGGGTVDLDLGATNTNTYSVKWFNPATGGVLKNGSVTSVQGTGSVNLGTAPYGTSDDWVILVQVPEPFEATRFESFCVLDSADAAAVEALLVSLGIQATTSNCDESSTGCTTPFANAGLDQVIGCGQTSVTLDDQVLIKERMPGLDLIISPLHQ